MVKSLRNLTLRIVFLTQWFYPEPGAIRGLPLAAWLVEHGHDVEVITGFPNYPQGKVYEGYRMRPVQRERVQGVDVIRLPLYPSRDYSAGRRLATYGSLAASTSVLGTALAMKADVSFVYHPPPTVGLTAMLWKRLRGLPFVYHIADMWPESVTESGMISSPLVRRGVGSTLSWWCDRVYRDAGAITVLSPGFRRLLIERGVPASKIELIYNWAEEDIFRPEPRNTCLAQTLRLEGKFNVLYTGNFGPFQRLDVAIEAATRVQHLDQFQLVLIGSGHCETELRGQAERLGAKNVRFIGRQEYAEMGTITNLADVLLVSLDDLPFFAATIPSKTQVALACGRPLLVAARGDAADLVERAGAGMTCAPADAGSLAAAFEAMYGLGASELNSMGTRGREFYERELSLQRGAERTEAVLAEVAKTGRAWSVGR